MQRTTEEMILIEQRVANEKKSTGTAYLLWFLLGGLSAHRFYLGKTTSALLQMLCIPVGIGMMLSENHFGLYLLAFGGVWLLLDAILIPSMVESHKNKVRRRLSGDT